jgi:uncharacterized circularly permuted ATP-grasp superfamily protein
VAGGAAPRIVLLTPGPYSETYFEHAYLARYLGLPLVEGGDLTVRADRLYLKTVEGLEPVHGVLRRLDDDWCDPLELRPDSALGVPGLLQAARAGTVVHGQRAGQRLPGDARAAGFPARHRRAAARRPLAPAGAAHLVVRRAAAWADVRPQLAGKLLRSTFPHGGRTSQVHDARDARIDDDPDAWTMQGRLRFSRAPIWQATAHCCRARRWCASTPSPTPSGRWHVLPGGMTRAAQREDASVSMQRGGSSLDTWVLTDGRVDHFSMLPRGCRWTTSRAASPVSSRTGENLFWLGRYTERTEQLVRLARTLLGSSTPTATPTRRCCRP